jgi:DNA-binding response OmpR family regulator
MKRILVLEDDRDTLSLLEKSLAEKFEVEAFTKGTAALARILIGYRDGWQFDALVLDCALPHFDGFTIARIVRMVEATGITNTPIRIAFFTAYPQTVESSTLLEEVKADQYFRKPEDIIRLPELISEWLCEGAQSPAR